MYQFFINSEDSKVIDYLKFLTFLSKEEIEELEKKNAEAPHLREAHKALAREVITFLHGEAEYEKAVKISQALFSGKIRELNVNELKDAIKEMQQTSAEASVPLVDALVNTKAASSRREARTFISSGAVSVNGEVVKDVEFVIEKANAFDNDFTILRRGKKNYYVLKHE